MLYNLFPTLVYKSTYTGDLTSLKDSIIPHLIPIFEEAKSNNQASMRNGSICSVNTSNRIQDKIDVADLITFVTDSVTEYWKQLGYVDSTIKVHHVWANKYPPGSYIENHNHSPAPLTASFYLSKPENSGNIIFENPLSTLLRYQPYKGLGDTENYASAFDETIEVDEGELVIFPGWLMHKTEINRSTKERIIIGFDITYEKNT